MDIEFGLDTFGDITTDPNGEPLTGAQTIRNVVERPFPPTALAESAKRSKR